MSSISRFRKASSPEDMAANEEWLAVSIEWRYVRWAAWCLKIEREDGPEEFISFCVHSKKEKIEFKGGNLTSCEESRRVLW